MSTDLERGFGAPSAAASEPDPPVDTEECNGGAQATGGRDPKKDSGKDHPKGSEQSADSADKPERSAAQQTMDKYLRRPVRACLTDGRVIVGELRCTDRDRNLVLVGAVEYRSPLFGNSPTPAQIRGYDFVPECLKRTRDLGAVMVPGNHIVALAVAPP
eukprot:m.48320 g.48320  ORF g.48320 m.48320 type:complete len:159 (+) comp11989_c0_seq1:232-708(+)